ncbi:hypothetical protein Poli38472_005668 [Pythium oligandrum]|uniref:Uncharacterized protein n=1 Tax=Pythium oligandrum TaxID=41045 RepID=A0A8K1CHY3_PYTOL|nr:hypothetical protein Poli38472_005668 [Pythium oligandrum]|eukprot:TMW63050.1 hypothetical protein Poli38472_005668 [Pythium oligandrum]
MLDAAELLRASATDADAVQQYLRTIDEEELQQVLDQFATSEAKKKDARRNTDSADDWLALVHLLLRTDTTRKRTATRLIQLLWRGNATELESTQWLTEISLGYVAAVDYERAEEAAAAADVGDRFAALAEELRVMMEIVFEFIRDVIAEPRANKVLPQLLTLVPLLLNILADSSMSSNSHESNETESVLREHVVRLLELPWDHRTVPSLLEVLREHGALVSQEGWAQLQESIKHLIVSQHKIPNDCLNRLFRECLYVASASQNAAWVDLARRVFRRLPLHLRQEAEFNLQMCLHQCPKVISLLTESIGYANASLPLDWRDAVLLLHAIRASKPILHHHQVTTARSDLKDVLFVDIQNLVWQVIEIDAADSTNTSGPHDAQPTESITLDKRIQHKITNIMTFSGHQVHTREWKAVILIDLAHFWMEQSMDRVSHGSKILQCIFASIAEVREAILRLVLDDIKVPGRLKNALGFLTDIVRDHTTLVIPHVSTLEDWVSGILHTHLDIAGACFRALSPLVQTCRDFYNFTMMFLQKLLSSPNQQHQQLAIDVWCSWMEENISLDTQQEEEVMHAIKNSIHSCRESQHWSFERLTRVFSPNSMPSVLRRESWELLHRFLIRAVSEFVETVDEPQTLVEDDDEILGEDDPMLVRFKISKLDSFYSQNKTTTTALELGTLFESILGCLHNVERAMSEADGVRADAQNRPSLSQSHSHLLTRWVTAVVYNWSEFSRWVSTGHSILGEEESDDKPTVGDDRYSWDMAARVSIASAFCWIVFRSRMATNPSISRSSEQPIWMLCEMQLCLRRLWRKFAISTPSVKTGLRGDTTDFADRGAESMRPHMLQLLTTISNSVSQSSQEKSSNENRMSLDGALFILDLYTTQLPRAEASRPAAVEDCPSAVAELKVLSTMYQAIWTFAELPKQISLSQDPSTQDHSPVRLTSYADALANQFPKTLRHLVQVESLTSHIVSLNAHAADELLTRICAAIAKAASWLMNCQNINCELVGNAFQPLLLESTTKDSVSVGQHFLRDARRAMGVDQLRKFKSASVSLAKRLLDSSLSRTSAKEDLSLVAGFHDAARIAYAILCEQVVQHLPTLRILLTIAFSPYLQFDKDFHVFDSVRAVLVASGFRGSKKALPGNDEMPLPKGGHRKRLRQLQPGELESDSTNQGSGEGREEEDTLQPSKSTGGRPLLLSTGAQAAAIQVVLVLLEAAQAQSVQGFRADSDWFVEHHGAIEQYIAINTLVVETILETADITWVTSRTLTKLISMLEASIRAGKVSLGPQTSADSNMISALLDMFESSVRFAQQGRSWLEMIREAAQEKTSKSRIAATILKLDVFLLDVPLIVSSVLKAKHIDPDLTSRLREFTTSIESTLSSSRTQHGLGAKKAKPHLVGVVPIVKTRRKRLRSRHPYIDACLGEEDGGDAFADLEDFIA